MQSGIFALRLVKSTSLVTKKNNSVYRLAYNKLLATNSLNRQLACTKINEDTTMRKPTPDKKACRKQ